MAGMHVFSHFRLRTKLAVMIAIPLVAMLFFSTDLMVDNSRKKQEMEGLVILSKLASSLSALVHETQKERGASAGFTGSKGKKFAEMLPKQRKLTDERYKQLEALLTATDLSDFGKTFEAKVADLLGNLEQLEQIRKQVSRLEMPLPKVVGWYTATNTKLLAVVEQMPLQITDADLVVRLTAYANYLQSKERAGIERAVLSATFGADRFAPGMYKKFIELVTAQNNYLHVFNALAGSEEKRFYQQAMRHESVGKVEQMRETAFENAASGGFGIDAEFWFKTITGKINQLKKVDDYLAEQVVVQASLRHDAVSTLFMLYLGGAALLLIITSWVSIQMGQAIRGPIEQMCQIIKEVVDNGDFSHRIQSEQEDEIGDMSRALNTLFDSLQTSIQESNRVVGDISRGIFDSRVTADLRGELLSLKEGVNGSAESVQRTMDTLSQVMRAITDGNFGYRLEGVEMEGGFRQELEQAMTSMDSIISDVNGVMDNVARGKFGARVSVEASGDLDRLKQNLNQSLMTLEEALREVVVAGNHLGDGDLRHTITGEYSGSLAVLKDSINATQANFSRIVAKVRAAAQHVRGSSDEISRGSMDLSSRTSEQAASLEETAASMEEMAGTVSMNADSAAQASQLSAESLLRAREGNGVVSEAVLAMAGINDSSNKIAEIISLIDGIAFQTNLLALNAAVEAARAGEHGRGFAVVAGEVRSLAQRSADAAKEIKSLIEDTTAKIQQGATLVERSGSALEAIEESVQKVNDITSEIESATKEQTQGIKQVNTAVTQLDSATQENAALVEETAASSSQLSHQADELSNLVAIFKLSEQAQEMVTNMSSANRVVADTFSKARTAHLSWKGKVRGFLNGLVEMSEEEAVSHHDCVLGKWLDKEGRARFAHLTEMQELDRVHEQMHTLIRDIVSLNNSGKSQEAEERFEEIEPLSLAVIEQLNQIEAISNREIMRDEHDRRQRPKAPSAKPVVQKKVQTAAVSGLHPSAPAESDEWAEF